MDNKGFRKRLKLGTDEGFTLIEVLIAVVILTAGLLGMAALTVGIMQGNKHSSNVTIATTLAQDQMEEVRRLGYSGMPSSNATSTEDYGSISGYSTFKRETDTVVASDLKTVTVTVYWDSNNKSIALQTMLAQK